MAQCKYCGKKGFFLSLSPNGLCKKCNPIVVDTIVKSSRVIQDCFRLVDESKKLDVRLSRRELLLFWANKLLEYEKKNIPTFEPLPSEIIEEYEPKYDQIIVEMTEIEINKYLSKVEKAVTRKTKVKYVENAISKLDNARKIIDNKSKLIVLDEKINLFIESNKLEDVLKTKQKNVIKLNTDDLGKKIRKISQPIIDEFLRSINQIEDEEELVKLSNIMSSKKIKMKDNLSNSRIKEVTGYSSLKEIALLLNIDSESLIKPLKQFYKTYINTSRSLLSQRISDVNALHYKELGGMVYWEFFGSILDDKTRDECQIGLGAVKNSKYPDAPFFTDEQKQLFQLSYGIRWDCRHEFTLITEKYYNNMTSRQ